MQPARVGRGGEASGAGSTGGKDELAVASAVVFLVSSFLWDVGDGLFLFHAWWFRGFRGADPSLPGLTAVDCLGLSKKCACVTYACAEGLGNASGSRRRYCCADFCLRGLTPGQAKPS